MRALTVRQPYAQSIVRGVKTIENRARNTHLRGPVLIHAGLTPHAHFQHLGVDNMPTAAIVGGVIIVDSHAAASCGIGCLAGGGFVNGVDPADPSLSSPWHWVLSDAVEFPEPITGVRGALGFWTPDEDTVRAARNAWPAIS